MSAAAPAPFQITGRHVLAGVCLFFAVVIGLDVLFATLAYRTFSGQSADNPYEAGLLYNQTLEQRRAEARLGWRAGVEAQGSRVRLSFADSRGQPIDGLRITGELTRPATQTGQRRLEFRNEGGGVYSAGIEGLSGAWDLSATAMGPDGERFEARQRFVLP